MSFIMFCVTRQQYPYQLSDAELKLFELDRLYLGVKVGQPDDEGYFDLCVKPHNPVDFIYVKIPVEKS